MIKRLILLMVRVLLDSCISGRLRWIVEKTYFIYAEVGRFFSVGLVSIAAITSVSRATTVILLQSA